MAARAQIRFITAFFAVLQLGVYLGHVFGLERRTDAEILIPAYIWAGIMLAYGALCAAVLVADRIAARRGR